MATIRQTLALVADGELVLPDSAIRALEVALDEALTAYARALEDTSGGRR